MAVLSHTLDIYGVQLHLATDRRDWAALRRRLPYLQKTPDSLGISHFATWHPADGAPPVPHLAIWINAAHLELHDLIDTAAHEAAHGASQILHWTGHDFRGIDGTDEPHAYLVGWLTAWIYKGCT